MPYLSTPPKPDDVFNQKVIYLCQQRGCGAQISEFPAAEKNTAPKYCKNCQNKETRKEIEAEYQQHYGLS